MIVTGTERYYRPCAIPVDARWVLNRCSPINKFASIVYTDRFGNMTIKFNQTVEVPRWREFFTHKTIKIKIIKNRALELIEPPVTDDMLKFSFDIVAAKGNLLLIKLKFDHEKFISSETIHDKV
jgi:hypothetical protein